MQNTLTILRRYIYLVERYAFLSALVSVSDFFQSTSVLQIPSALTPCFVVHSYPVAIHQVFWEYLVNCNWVRVYRTVHPRHTLTCGTLGVQHPATPSDLLGQPTSDRDSPRLDSDSRETRPLAGSYSGTGCDILVRMKDTEEPFWLHLFQCRIFSEYQCVTDPGGL